MPRQKQGNINASMDRATDRLQAAPTAAIHFAIREAVELP
jgi:hypothetical protein